MSNKATKTFFIEFSIVFVVGIVLFIIASNSGEAKTDQPKKEVDTSNIEVLGPDIWGNQYVTIDGEKSILIE